MGVGNLGASESEEEEESGSEKFGEDGDGGVISPFWDYAVDEVEAFAERNGGVLGTNGK